MQTPNYNLDHLIQALRSNRVDGRTQSVIDRLASLRQIAEAGGLHTLEPLLPLCLTLQGKPYDLSDHYPFSPLFKTRMPRMTVIISGRQVSKCVPLSDRPVIWLADGRVVGTKQVRVGDQVLAVDADNRRQVRRVLAVHDTGYRDVFLIQTRLGSEIEHTGDHRIRTPSGFTAVSRLRPGSHIAAVRTGGVLEDVGILVAAPRIQQLAERLGRQCRRTRESTQRRAVKLRIPDNVFQFGRRQLCQFIRQLWAAAGGICSTSGTTIHATQREILVQLRSLLAKFGIPCGIDLVPASRRTRQTRWRLYVATKQGCDEFLRQFQPPGQDLMRPSPASRNKKTFSEPVVSEDVVWDEVVSVTRLGRRKTIDLEIEVDHNYVYDGVYTHNSTSLASHGVMLSNSIPYFRTLYVTPLYEQIRRFSNNYVRPFIERSPIKSLWTGTNTENSVLQRSFKNLSVMLFSFALLDADRVRGISTDKICLDEVQDMDPDHIPIIKETMSHSNYGIMQCTGTPKSLDGPLEALWRRSSQAEWFIPCFSCGAWNIPSLEYHIHDMIGPYHSEISEMCPGTICHRCKKPIFPRHGHWVHRYPDRRESCAGYHVPQIIMPLHYARDSKWAELLAKREGWGNTSMATFHNEVLGISVDAGQKLVSETELRAAAVLPWRNDPNNPDPQVMASLPRYETRVLAVDWGGGGEDGVSFTTLALLGYHSSGTIDLLWGKRLVASQEHLREAREVLHWVRAFRCHVIAHDYTGAGVVRETVLVQAGVDLDRVMAIQYVRAASSNLMRYVPATVLHNRAHYRLDKTRSLLYTFQAIKLRLLRTFAYDYQSDDNPGLLHDFLALVEEKTESRLAGDIYTITRNPMLTDDFAQAVNIGCAACWHINGAWPNFAEAAAIGRITPSQVMAAGNRDYGWEEDKSSFFRQP